MSAPRVTFQRLAHGRGLPLPRYMTPGAAGMDLPAAVEPDEEFIIEPGAIEVVPTGLAIAIPAGFEGQVRPRSGLAFSRGIGIINAPGTIDSDYRGEIKIALINLGSEPVSIRRGDRVAQLIIAPVAQAQLVEADELPPTERGDGGFGHTGMKP